MLTIVSSEGKKMKTEETAKLWEALELLTKAESYNNSGNFEKAMEKIKEAEALITPLRDL
jgi:hypothetical protein